VKEETRLHMEKAIKSRNARCDASISHQHPINVQAGVGFLSGENTPESGVESTIGMRANCLGSGRRLAG
jgi:hypothetical protein